MRDEEMTARTVLGKGMKEVVHSLLQRQRGFVKYKSAQMRTQTAIISIQELTSEAIPSLAQALKAVPGVQKVDFSLERSVAVVEFDREQSIVDDLLRAVLKAGYKLS
jgi:copper chaperone CopZ